MEFVNSTNVSTDARLLEVINDVYFTYQLPAIVFTSIMMLLGLPGNMIVFYIYFFKWRRSTSRMFILFLAALDMTNCAINLPLELYIMRFFVMFEQPYLCKVSRFLSYMLNSSSALILVAISVDRFRRICRPYKKSFSNADSKYTCTGLVIFSVATTWPALFLYGVRTIQIGVVRGQTCLLENQYDHTLYPGAYIVFMSVMTLGLFTILVVLYYFVGLQIYKHRTFKLRKCTHVEQFQEKEKSSAVSKSKHEEDIPEDPNENKQEKNASTDDANGNISVVSKHIPVIKDVKDPATMDNDMAPESALLDTKCISNNDGHGAGNTIPENKSDNLCMDTLTPGHLIADFPSVGQSSIATQNIHLDQIVPTDETTKQRQTTTRKEKAPKSQRRKRVRYLLVRNSSTIHRPRGSTKCNNCITVNVGRSTYMLFLISIAFVISFLPFYTALIIRQLDETFLSRILRSKGAYMAYFLIVRSYLLSSAINPIIYSFCNAQFRKLCVETFTGACKSRESVYYQRSKR